MTQDDFLLKYFTPTKRNNSSYAYFILKVLEEHDHGLEIVIAKFDLVNRRFLIRKTSIEKIRMREFLELNKTVDNRRLIGNIFSYDKDFDENHWATISI